jgi:transposase-like protein
MDSRSVFCPNLTCPVRRQPHQGNIRVQSQKTRRYRRTVCGRTFAASTGTAVYRLHRPALLFVQVVTLLAYGCAPAAIVAAFGLDELTVAAWHLVLPGPSADDARDGHWSDRPLLVGPGVAGQAHPSASLAAGAPPRPPDTSRTGAQCPLVCLITVLSRPP